MLWCLIFILLLCIDISIISCENNFNSSEEEVIITFNILLNYEVPSFTIIEYNNNIEYEVYEVRKNMSVYRYISPLCPRFSTYYGNVSCFYILNNINMFLYDTEYTTTTPNATVFDFTADRGT